MKGRKAVWYLLGMCLTMLMLGGCTRAVINRQIAEAIGTQGMYENGEPVESPKMKTEREQKESREALEAAFMVEAERADRLAASYQYQDAIDYINTLTPDEVTQQLIDNKIEEYETAASELRVYNGPIPHFCFPTLIEDPVRAFANEDRKDIYSSSMLTTSEFRQILQNLYDKGYVMVNIHDVVGEVTDERGVKSLERKEILLPREKKPIIISQDNVNYANVKNGDGIAIKLVLNEEGEIKALYTDDGGHDLKGDYDLVPIIDSFAAEHPDFSYHGAKGIVSVSGKDGVFGYSLEEEPDEIAAIAGQLKKSGWLIASTGYSHDYMNTMDEDTLKKDINQWNEDVGELTGLTDILFYPYGGEVQYPSDQLDFLLKQGFKYLCGLWSQEDYLGIEETYLRQTRRFLDGYTLNQAPEYFTDFFVTKDILDPERSKDTANTQ